MGVGVVLAGGTLAAIVVWRRRTTGPGPIQPPPAAIELALWPQPMPQEQEEADEAAVVEDEC